jgi:hypothetical protein
MILVLAGFIIEALIDLIPIIKKREWRALAAFLLLYTPALGIAILLAMKIKVPSTMEFLGGIIKSLGLSY